MRAFLFSGQGSQKVDMAAPLLAQSGIVRRQYKTAAELVGYTLDDLTANELAETKNTQLAVTVFSAALWDALPDEEKQDAVLAGFSLGEYTALYAAGVVSFADMIQLIIWRSQFMQEVIDRSEALGMAAVLGLDEKSVQAVLADQHASADPETAVYAVNYNSPEQTVISGAKATIEALKPAFLKAGAGRLLPLRVAGAFHTPFFAEAADKLKEKAATLSYKAPTLPLYSNLTGEKLAPSIEWPEYLKTTLVSPVYFTTELRRLESDGVRHMVEVGPGTTLIGLVKKTLPDMQTTHAIDLLD